jgi:protein TonB
MSPDPTVCPSFVALSALRTSSKRSLAPEAINHNSWRYPGKPRSKKIIAFAAAFSVSAHVALLFGFNPAKKAPAPAATAPTLTLSLEFHELKELDEPEPTPTEDTGEKLEPGDLVPMLADAPQLPTPNDFVQDMDFSSLMERPDLSHAKVVMIPEHIGRGGKIGDKLGKIFDLSDLDRAPVPTLQTPPIPPRFIKSEGIAVTVEVEFVVTAAGQVVNAFARTSTDRRGDDSAVLAVSKWKFRPGIKSGQKVNVRMMVPIKFKPSDSNGA